MFSLPYGSQTRQTSGIKLLAVTKMQLFMNHVFEGIFVDQIHNSFILHFIMHWDLKSLGELVNYFFAGCLLNR